MSDVNGEIYQSVQKPRAAPGRPRAFDPDQALDAAIRVFLVHGYDGATLDHLTAAMGIGRPSVYAAFGDKRSLFGHALRRYGVTRGSEPLRAFEAATGTQDAAEAFLATAVRNNTRDPGAKGCLFACTATAAAQTQEDTRTLLEAVGREAVPVLIARFAADIAAGHLDPGFSAEARAAMLIDLQQGMAARARAGGEVAALLADAATYARMLAR